jgi:hypothetical protein
MPYLFTSAASRAESLLQTLSSPPFPRSSSSKDPSVAAPPSSLARAARGWKSNLQRKQEVLQVVKETLEVEREIERRRVRVESLALG